MARRGMVRTLITTFTPVARRDRFPGTGHHHGRATARVRDVSSAPRPRTLPCSNDLAMYLVCRARSEMFCNGTLSLVFRPSFQTRYKSTMTGSSLVNPSTAWRRNIGHGAASKAFGQYRSIEAGHPTKWADARQAESVGKATMMVAPSRIRYQWTNTSAIRNRPVATRRAAL